MRAVQLTLILFFLLFNLMEAQSLLLEPGEHSRGFALGYATGEDISQLTFSPVFSRDKFDIGVSLARDFEEGQFIVSPFIDYFLLKSSSGANFSLGARYVRPTEHGSTGTGQFNSSFYYKAEGKSSIIYPSIGLIYISDFQGSFEKLGPYFGFNYVKRKPTGYLGFGASYVLIEEAKTFTFGLTYQLL